MNRRLNTVLDQSGADSVLPSPAGWEKTILILKRGSSLEAHDSRYGIADIARSFERCSLQASLGKVVGSASWRGGEHDD